MKQNNRRTGSIYEERAAEFLTGLGYEIIERNFRCRSGEIDLIGRDGTYLVFIEVKYRSTLQNGYPSEAVGRKKQRQILHTARYYLLTHGYGEETLCRFDVAAILKDEIHLIKDAFWSN